MRGELLRTAAADVLHLTGIEDTAEALTVVAQVSIRATLEAAIAETERAIGPLPTRIAIIARPFGGHEMGYASDGDVLFVHAPLPGAPDEAATRAAHAVAETLRALLSKPGPVLALLIDAGLRPEGRQGPLVRTLASYQAYYQRWSVPWEAQAVPRAEFAAGDREVGAAFLAMADDIRYPQGGIELAAVREIRRIKARMEAERMPRGVEPALHLKLGPGGLADVDGVAQLLQLQHAWAEPSLRTTRTHAVLAAASSAGLIPAAEAGTLNASWLLATRIRDAVMLVRGRPSDTLPTLPVDLAVVAQVLGYPPGGAQDLVQDWRRSARQARAVMERIFYGVTRRPGSRPSGRRVSSWKRTGESGWRSPRHRRPSAGHCRIRCSWRPCSASALVLRCGDGAGDGSTGAGGGGGSVIVKRYPPTDEGAESFTAEAAGLVLAIGTGLVPQLLATDPDLLVVVMSDLGDGATLADLLLGDGGGSGSGGSADDARAAWLGWAHACGELSAATLRRVGELAGLRDQFSGGHARRTSPPWVGQNILTAPERAAALGVQVPDGLADELAEVARAVQPDRFGVFSPGDLCPDNSIVTAGGVRLLDFEAAEMTRHSGTPPTSGCRSAPAGACSGCPPGCAGTPRRPTGSRSQRSCRRSLTMRSGPRACAAASLPGR